MISIPLALLFTHFVGDFLFQTDEMALKKGRWPETVESILEWIHYATPIKWDGLFNLFDHALMYSIFFIYWGPLFAIITFVTHIITDGLTSQLTSHFWFIELEHERARGGDWINYAEAVVRPWKRHWFFVIIGLDQLIHFTTLALTLRYLP